MGFLSGLFHSREDPEMNFLPEGMRKRLPELCTLDFIREGKNIIMTGNPGTGKTHTAIRSCRFVLCIKIYMPNQYFL